MLIIGEMINATRKSVKEAVINQDVDFLKDLAQKQDEAGSHYIDVNVATGVGKQEREVEYMKWAVKSLKEVTEKPLSIDTATEDVLRAGLEEHGPGAMINSVAAEEGRLTPFLKLAKEYECKVIALPATEEEGIPKDVDTRLKIAQQIVDEARNQGFPPENLYFDPLAMPLGVDDNSGLIAINAIRAFKEKLNVSTTVGLTNISHGLPARALLNRTFLTLARGFGLDSAILNPLDKAVMSSLKATEAFLGNDPFCGEYLKAYRKGILVT